MYQSYYAPRLAIPHTQYHAQRHFPLYWTIKATGERRTKQIPIYKCQNAWQGVPHDKTKQHRADKIEPIVFEALAKYIGKLQKNENVFEQIQANQNTEKSFIFDHDSIASLLRELNRNSQLRIICGFQPHIYSVLTDKKDEYGKRIRESRYKLAPTASAYTNFLNNLKECEQELREMFDTLVKDIGVSLILKLKLLFY